MAVASAVGDGGNIALAEGPEICFCRPGGPAPPGVLASRLAPERSRRTRCGAWTRRPLAAGCPVAAANHVTAGRDAGRAAGSSGEPFQNAGIGAPDAAGLA